MPASPSGARSIAPPAALSSEEADDGDFAAAVERLRAPARRRSWAWLGVVSALAFVAVMVLDVDLQVALIVAAVLLFHEAGHWAAMRLTGQRDVRIFFLPFFGAVTTASTQPADAGARALISLAGPIPGVVLGVALLRLYPTPCLQRAVAMVLLYVNVLNLMPIGFLDGGRVVSTLFLARLPALEAGFGLVSAVVLAAYFLGGNGSAAVFGGLAFAVIIQTSRAYRLAKAAQEVAPHLAGASEVTALSDSGLRALHAAALRVAEEERGPRNPERIAGLMRDLFARGNRPVPTAEDRWAYGLAWAAALGIGWVVLAAAGGKLVG